MKTLISTSIDGCVVAVFGKTAPSGADWTEYLGLVQRDVLTSPRQRGLIVSHGGTPENSQRRELERVTGRSAAGRRLAVLTNATFVRGVLKAMSIFDPSYRGFSLSDLDLALRYLEVPERSWSEIQRLVQQASADLGC